MILARFAVLLSLAASLGAAVVHYDVTVTVDPQRGELRGRETITIPARSGPLTLSTGDQLAVSKGGAMDLPASPNRRQVKFEYTARAARGFRWIDGSAGFFTAFYCEVWMVCDTSPAERATIRLEVLVPLKTGWTVAGPGVLRHRWRNGEYDHFLFERNQPAQTFLFSFAAAKMTKVDDGPFTIYAASAAQSDVFRHTCDAYAFLRSKAGADLMEPHYVQVFLPGVNPAQEAAGMALMGEGYRQRLAEDDVALMTHELAHQWWAVLVGIRSWSDFWLNEGFAEFLTIAYLEHHQGRPAYDAAMGRLRESLDKLRAEGKDRPLHWTKWTSASDALGRLPYVKGALFLDLLRRELGDDLFWRGLAAYTSRHAGQLVDSRDFQKVMEEVSGRSLAPLFDAWVWR